jgi:ribosomal protein L37AE/L43A
LGFFAERQDIDLGFPAQLDPQKAHKAAKPPCSSLHADDEVLWCGGLGRVLKGLKLFFAGGGVARATPHVIPACRRLLRSRSTRRWVCRHCRARVDGSINVLWIRAAFTVHAFAARYLRDLQEAAFSPV